MWHNLACWKHADIHRNLANLEAVDIAIKVFIVILLEWPATTFAAAVLLVWWKGWVALMFGLVLHFFLLRGQD